MPGTAGALRDAGRACRRAAGSERSRRKAGGRAAAPGGSVRRNFVAASPRIWFLSKPRLWPPLLPAGSRPQLPQERPASRCPNPRHGEPTGAATAVPGGPGANATAAAGTGMGPAGAFSAAPVWLAAAPLPDLSRHGAGGRGAEIHSPYTAVTLPARRRPDPLRSAAGHSWPPAAT